MQIRVQGNKIQLIRTHYIKEKKRTEGKVFASLKLFTYIIPDSVRDELTSDEIKQLENFLSKLKESDTINELRYHLSSISTDTIMASKALSVEELVVSFTPEKAAAIYSSIDVLKKALKKAGYTKEKRQPKPVTVDPRQTTFIDPE
jgi:hypothetical protein